MISRVYEQAVRLNEEEDFECDACVVTDDKRIEDHILSAGGKVVRVDDDVQSGTERIFLAYQRFFSEKSYDFIVNVQGDEPLLRTKDLKDLVAFHSQTPFNVATIVEEKKDFSEFKDPNRVKAVYEKSSGQCHYFSRAPIPHDRDGGDMNAWFLHVGVYSYRPSALEKFCQSPVSELEKIEKLEQLRALGQGLTIGATKANHEFIGVDHPEDKEKVEGVLREFSND